MFWVVCQQLVANKSGEKAKFFVLWGVCDKLMLYTFVAPKSEKNTTQIPRKYGSIVVVIVINKLFILTF